MNKSIFHSKPFIVSSIIAGLIGTATFSLITFSYGISGLGLGPMFGAIYYSAVADIVLSVGVVNAAKGLANYNFMEKFSKKHKQANGLYEEMSKQNSKLKDLISSHVLLTDKKARLHSYINIMKEQNLYNKMIKSADDLPEKERESLKRFVNLKATLFDINYYDPDLQKMLNKSENKTKTKTSKQPSKKVEVTEKQTKSEPKIIKNDLPSYNHAEEKTL